MSSYSKIMTKSKANNPSNKQIAQLFLKKKVDEGDYDGRFDNNFTIDVVIHIDNELNDIEDKYWYDLATSKPEKEVDEVEHADDISDYDDYDDYDDDRYDDRYDDDSENEFDDYFSDDDYSYRSR